MKQYSITILYDTDIGKGAHYNDDGNDDVDNDVLNCQLAGALFYVNIPYCCV